MIARVCFIGEIPPPKKYENYFDPKHSEKKDKKDEEMVWNSKKYEYEEDFGETLVGKKRPGIFVYSLETNQLQQVSFPFSFPSPYLFSLFNDSSHSSLSILLFISSYDFLLSAKKKIG